MKANKKKEKLLTQDYLKSILGYNPKTGIFINKVIRGGGGVKGKIAGRLASDGYIDIAINNESYRSHRLAWFYVYGIWPKTLDHTNRIKTDNRISNLREATKFQNQWNRGRQRNNTSGFKGVSFNKKERRFRANICKDSKIFHIGSFSTAEEAHFAYCKKGKELHGEFFNGGTK